MECGTDGHVLEVGGAGPMRLHTARVINAAGLGAPLAAHARLSGRPVADGPCPGNYFACRAEARSNA
jgi:L-2-hydroxyglutarate oxidase LhgO